MSCPRPILILGYTPTLFAGFASFLPDDGLVVLDDPDPVRKRGLRPVMEAAPVCRELIEEEYLRPGGADAFFLAHPDLSPAAVIPAHDYAVPAAARIAERYDVPGATLGAAEILRDKHALRVIAAAAGVANPASRPVASARDVLAFQAEIGGAVIIKPANRQAAIGTMVVRDPTDIPAAWEECLEQEAEAFLPDRAIEVRMLAEQVISGAEYSVELLYGKGERMFANVTAKELYPGSRPVERGHLVPAPITAELAELLIAETERVLSAAGFGTGLVHCEWIVQNGTPYLVECAGRLPGDFITELIHGAYDFDFLRAYASLMMGEHPQGPLSAARGAAIWYDTALPGEVVSIAGVAEAQALPGVKRCTVTVEVGMTVPPLRSSWGRTAVATALADSAASAKEIAQRAIGLIRIETR
jgi:biotin carboxylase